MFVLRRPDENAISRFLAEQRTSHLSYVPVGLSSQSPSGYHIDEHRVKLGNGKDVYEWAKSALDTWTCFDIDWVEIRTDNVAPAVSTNVAVVVHHFGIWSLNACRVVLRFPVGPDDSRYGFAYGTLAEHAERGEEQFVVRFDPSDESVWYAVRAVSKPRALLARLGGPVSRVLQKKFRDESANAMIRATGRWP